MSAAADGLPDRDRDRCELAALPERADLAGLELRERERDFRDPPSSSAGTGVASRETD